MIRALPGSRITAELLDPEHALTLADLTGEVRDNDVLVLSVPNSAISFDESFEAVFTDPGSTLGSRMSFVWLSGGVEVDREPILITDTAEDPGYTVGVEAMSYLQNDAPDIPYTATLSDNGALVQSIASDAITFDECPIATWTPAVAGRYTFAWFDGATNVGSEVITVASASETTYTTPQALRLELNMDEDDTDALSDAAATKLILDAEDAIDAMLGVGYYWVDEDTGRKVDQDEVQPWQWAKLDRATAKMAAAIKGNPTMLGGQQYDRIKGPDFEREGLRGSQIGSQITSLLDDSRLRRLTSRAGDGQRRIRDGYQRFLSATRHDGT